jgi:hypothetical protein
VARGIDAAWEEAERSVGPADLHHAVDTVLKQMLPIFTEAAQRSRDQASLAALGSVGRSLESLRSNLQVAMVRAGMTTPTAGPGTP